MERATMSQISFSDAEYAGKRKKTRREVFLEEMEVVVPWKALLALIEPHYPVAGRGRRPYPLESMLRVHLMQNWFALSDPAMEEALYEIASLRSFANLSLAEAIPDETTILNFRHLLEANDLAEDILKAVNAHLARKGLLLKKGSIVDATIIAAPSSTKNAHGERDREMHQTKKGNQWHFGMKAHIAVDADSGLVHTVTTTAANESDVEQIADLLHGKEQDVWADSAIAGRKRAWIERICNGTSPPGPATLPSCLRDAARRWPRSTSSARPACAPRSSTRFASSSASSD
jgi:transposase, IS5 family